VRWYIEFMGDSVELPRGETVIGRDVGCAVRFNDPSVSRRHLKFIRRREECFVEDLGSSNGTLLNGRTLTAPLRIHDGDVVTVGGRILTIRVVSDVVAEELPDTLVPRDEVHGDQPPVTDEDVVVARRATNVMKRVTPPAPANQRCPQCASVVSDTDEECATCHYRWGARPRTTTLPSPVDRRRHERHEVELRLVYISAELEIEATTRDLSQSGVFICSQILDPIGTKCQLTILIDGGPALHVAGVVRRVVSRDATTPQDGAVTADQVGFGVEFELLGTEERAWIDIAVARMTRPELGLH
jgi:FHA domain-containing protein/PilZ domain-containing protein